MILQRIPRKFQCFVKCYLEKLVFIDAFGNNRERVAINALAEDGDRAKVIRDVNTCKLEKGASVCETAYRKYKCYILMKLKKNWFTFEILPEKLI